LEVLNQVELTSEKREKIRQTVNTLWLYDLRKLTSCQKHYSQIIKNIFSSIQNNEPVNFVQFSCTKRNKLSTNLSDFVSQETEGSNLLPNLPFLQILKTDLENKGIDVKITILLADSENYWVDLQEGKDLDLGNQNLLEILKPQWESYAKNLQNEVNQITNSENFVITQTSKLEEEMKRNGTFDFEIEFGKLQDRIFTKHDLKLIAKMSFVWKNVLEGNQRNAFADAEEQITTMNFESLKYEDLEKIIEPKYLQITKKQLAEYALQGQMLEILQPNAILLQNERPADTKNYFYNIDETLRNQPLPEISPYFYQ